MGLISSIKSAVKSAASKKSGSSNSSSGSSSSKSSGSSSGYGSGSGYGNRETAFTWKDGSTTYSNATRSDDAAKEAGKENVGLASAVSYYSSGTQKKNGSYSSGGGSDGKGGTNGQTSFTNNIYSQNKQTGKAYDNAIKYEQQVANNYGLGTDKSVGKYGTGYGYTDTYYNPTKNIPMLPGIAENLGVSNSGNAYSTIKDFGVNTNTNTAKNAYGNNNNAYGNNNYGNNSNPYEANPYSELLKKSQRSYDGMEDQIEDMNAASVKQGIDRLEANRQGIKTNYEDSAKQAYTAMMLQNKKLVGQLEADGLNGGATETGRLQISNNYMNNLNGINTGLNKEISSLDNSITDLKNTGDLQTQQQILQNSQAALDAYNALMQNKINYDYTASRDSVSDQRYAKEYSDNLAWKEKEYNNNNQWQQKEYDNTLNQQTLTNAYNLLQLGYGTGEVAKTLGLSESQVNAYTDYITKQRQYELSSSALDLEGKKLSNQQFLKTLNKTTSSGSSRGSSVGSGGSKAKTYTLTYAQAKKELDGGNYTPAALAVYKQYNGEGYKTSGTEKINAIYNKAQAIGASYDGVVTAVKQMLVTGQISEDDMKIWESSR